MFYAIPKTDDGEEEWLKVPHPFHDNAIKVVYKFRTLGRSYKK